MKAKLAAAMILASTLAVMPIGGGGVIMASGDGGKAYYYGRTNDNANSGYEDEPGEEESDDDAPDSGYFRADPVDWNGKLELIDSAIQSPLIQNVNILTGDSFVVPADILNRIAGKDATLALHAGNGLAFSIPGRRMGKTEAVFAIHLIPPSIPEYRKQEILAGASASYLIHMQDKNAYPFPVNVHVRLGAEHAGKVAFFYSYAAADSSLHLMGSFRVTESGQAMFPLKQGGEYVVLVPDKVAGYVVKGGENLSVIAARHKVSLDALAAVNPQIGDVGRVDAGQAINIPVR